MTLPLTYEYNALSYTYPDDESDKELFLQVPSATLSSSSSTSYHCTVLIYWVNIAFPDGEEVWQVLRLDRRSSHPSGAGAYKMRHVYPDLIVVDGIAEREHNATFPLGAFTRDNREMVLECAEEVEYDPDGDPEEATRWMTELLERMVSEGLVTRGVVDEIKEAVPLPNIAANQNHGS